MEKNNLQIKTGRMATVDECLNPLYLGDQSSPVLTATFQPGQNSFCVTNW